MAKYKLEISSDDDIHLAEILHMDQLLSLRADEIFAEKYLGVVKVALDAATDLASAWDEKEKAMEFAEWLRRKASRLEYNLQEQNKHNG